MIETAATWNIGAIDQGKAARRRATWSPLETPTTEEIILIADLLGFSEEALSIAAARGLLFCATCRDGHRSFIVSDSRRLSAAAYRLDGLPWEQTNRITRILPGSIEGWPVGIDEAATFPAIALVCGGTDLLAAFHLSWCADREDVIAPVVILSPATAISDTALLLFAGKEVCLFSHTDQIGRQAKNRWGRQLVATGIEPEIYDLSGLTTAAGSPIFTLSDFVHVHPVQWDEHRDIIESAFTFGPALSTPAPQTKSSQQDQPHGRTF